jgi:hypothetical protein
VSEVTEETPITVQREWNGWRCADVRLGDLQDVHWRQPPGAPRAIVHGYVSPVAMLSGDLVQEAGESAPDGRLLVCVIRCHVASDVYAALTARARPPHAHLVATA